MQAGDRRGRRSDLTSGSLVAICEQILPRTIGLGQLTQREAASWRIALWSAAFAMERRNTRLNRERGARAGWARDDALAPNFGMAVLGQASSGRIW